MGECIHTYAGGQRNPRCALCGAPRLSRRKGDARKPVDGNCKTCKRHHPNGWACPKELITLRAKVAKAEESRALELQRWEKLREAAAGCDPNYDTISAWELVDLVGTLCDEVLGKREV